MSKIILKVDDFEADKFSLDTSFYKFIQIIEKYNIKISLGVIGMNLENPSIHISEIKELIINNLIEPYNHSYYHMYDSTRKLGEFQNTSLKYQVDSIDKTQEVIHRQLNFNSTVFGSCSNRWDLNTISVIRDSEEIKFAYVYIGSHNLDEIIKCDKKIVIINGYGSLEYNYKFQRIYKRHVIEDLSLFVTKFDKINEPKVFQLHPSEWNDMDLECFEIILKYLIKNKHEFIFPTNE
jgi:hypothetical protein